MPSSHLLLEEPIRMASILEPSKPVSLSDSFIHSSIHLYIHLFIFINYYLFICYLFFILQSFFPAMTKIVGTLGPKSRSVDAISGCLKAGMSGLSLFFFPFLSEILKYHTLYSVNTYRIIC